MIFRGLYMLIFSGIENGIRVFFDENGKSIKTEADLILTKVEEEIKTVEQEVPQEIKQVTGV